MRVSPWFGFMRGLLFALWPGMRYEAVPAAQAPTAWGQASRRRRRALLAIIGALSAAALHLQVDAGPADPAAIWWVQTALATLLFAWVGAGFATALMGAWVMRRGDPHALSLRDPRAPIDPAARTAIIVPICNEDVATVFAGLSASCESLATTGALPLFDVYVLSDTSDPALREAEVKALHRLRERLGDDGGQRIFYRWRKRRTKRKAGNVADFCRRWGRLYRYMIVFDADSTMHGETLVSMVRLMEQNPRAGIIQTLPQGAGHGTLHARLQQFGARVTGRLFALGMSYWQLGESHYWGHNAILRVEPFMRHCGLAPLPGRGGLGGEILSHDFVEAALMRRAGYEVWLAPELDGSWEQHPPNLLEELQRDRRWCQGNLQNARLIAEPGWRPVHRVMFIVGAFSYAVAPLWFLFVAIGLAGAVASGASAALWALTLVLLVLPRALGVVAVCARGEQRQFGGTARLVASAALELGMSAFQAPLRMLAHSVFVLGSLTGLKLNWKSPARDAAAVGWRDAMSRIGVLALPAFALSVLALHGHDMLALHFAPWLLPLALAVPFTVLTGSPKVGEWLQRRGLLATPEESEPPRTLVRAADRVPFADLLPAPKPLPAPAAMRPAAARGASLALPRLRPALAVASVALVVTGLLPRAATSPELSQAMRADRELFSLLRSAPQIDPPEIAILRVAHRPVAVSLDKPAQMIDDGVRERALEAVRRAVGASPAETLDNLPPPAAAESGPVDAATLA